MEDNNTTPEAVPEASQLNAADANGTVGNVSADGMTLSELNQHLGKNFPNRDSALKAIKDTFSYVGKKKEDVKKEVLSEVNTDKRIDQLAKELAEERKERFYDRNPQYKDLRSVIENAGGDPAEVVTKDWFKEISTKISGYNETQKLKTVLESNPRLSSSRDSLTKAREVASKTIRPTEEVEALVASAVKDAYGL